MLPSPRLAGAVICLLAAAAPLRAQQVIESRRSGSDIVVEAVDASSGCSGDLYRADQPGLEVDQGTLVQAGAACPATVTGDAALRGTDDGLYYYLTAPGDPLSHTSGMAFRQEIHLDVSYFPSGEPTQNVMFVSVPTHETFEDLANTAAPEADKCVGDPGGPAAADGILNADDLVCAWWTSRGSGAGSLVVARRDEASASWLERGGLVDPTTGAITFAGPWTDPLDGPGAVEEGYEVLVDGPSGTENRFIVTGGHDATTLGRVISGARDQTFVLDVPYHTTYRKAVEILCGRERVDWYDANGDSWPDTCPAGVFDGAHRISVLTFDNVMDNSTLTFDGSWAWCTVTTDVFGLHFTGTNFPVRPGQAYLLQVTPAQTPTVFLSPHY